MGRLILIILYVSLFLSCGNTKNATANINPFLDKRESYFLRGKVYWDIEQKSLWQLDTAAYYFKKYLGEDTIKSHHLTKNEERALSWLSEIYYRKGDFKHLDALAKLVMRLYSGHFTVVNSIWFNFSESNSLYPHNPEFDKTYTDYFKKLLGFGNDGKYSKQREALEEVFENDQRFRLLLLNKNNEIDSVPKAIRDSIERVDSINISIVSDIIEQYGWLGPTDVGIKAVMGEFYTIQHADRAIFLKYYPIIKEADKQGKLDHSYYELYIDRMNVYLHKPQVYGTQKSYDSTLKKWVSDPL